MNDETAVDTILSIKKGDMLDPSTVPVVSDDAGRHYYLPGCGYEATLKALEEIGFRPIDRISSVVSANPLKQEIEVTFNRLAALLDEHMDRWAPINSEEGLRVFGETHWVDLKRIDNAGRLEEFARVAKAPNRSRIRQRGCAKGWIEADPSGLRTIMLAYRAQY